MSPAAPVQLLSRAEPSVCVGLGLIDRAAAQQLVELQVSMRGSIIEQLRDQNFVDRDIVDICRPIKANLQWRRARCGGEMCESR